MYSRTAVIVISVGFFHAVGVGYLTKQKINGQLLNNKHWMAALSLYKDLIKHAEFLQ